jgi:uncharacterized membrane protein
MEGRVPLQNYAAWFGISAVAVWVLTGGTAEKAIPRLPVSLLVYGLQFGLFCPLVLLRGHVVEALVACALVGLCVITSRVMTRGHLSWKGT